MRLLVYISFVVFLFANCTPKNLGRAFDANKQFGIQEINFTPAVINKLKATTTVFLYRRPKGKPDERLEAAIKAAWDFTPLVFDDISKLEKYGADTGYSYFSIESSYRKDLDAEMRQQHWKRKTYDVLHTFLMLRLNYATIENKNSSLPPFARMELFPEPDVIEGIRNIHGSGYSHYRDVARYQGRFYNWSPVSVAAQIRAVNLAMHNSYRPWLFKNIVSAQLLDRLKNDTLYVSSKQMVYFNKEGDVENLYEKMFSGYPYKYRICSDDQLYKIFHEEKRGKLLFEYVLSNTDKFISVYDYQTGEVLYKHYYLASANIKEKDLSNLAEGH